ncbi:6148_t:CDS:2, partial [Entrophospora sp. SA101]
VFKGSGYGVTVDWWSLGVIFYECIYGGFLERDISKRLGCGMNGFALIQNHPFFQLLLEEQPLDCRPSRKRKSRRRKDYGNNDYFEKEEAQYQLIEEKFKPFDYTVFEKYEGWVDPVTRCVSDPPEWVKPAAVELANQKERESQDGATNNGGR